MNEIKGIEQGRAAFAYKCVKEVLEKFDQDVRGKYKSYAKKLPSMIKANGLGQAFAFVKSKSKGEKAYGILYDQTSDWLRQKQLRGDGELIEQIVNLPSEEYRQWTAEVLSLFNWLRRFADGLIEEEKKT